MEKWALQEDHGRFCYIIAVTSLKNGSAYWGVDNFAIPQTVTEFPL